MIVKKIHLQNRDDTFRLGFACSIAHGKSKSTVKNDFHSRVVEREKDRLRGLAKLKLQGVRLIFSASVIKTVESSFLIPPRCTVFLFIILARRNFSVLPKRTTKSKTRSQMVANWYLRNSISEQVNCKSVYGDVADVDHRGL